MYEQFGTYGAWLNPALGDAPRIEYAPQLEELGYQTIWVGIGADPVGDMNLLEQMIAATRHAIIASAIINMWQDDARSIAQHYHRIVDRYGPRLLLGIGLGHPEKRDAYEKPYERMVHYVDALLEGKVPAEAIVLGALGTNTLKLAGEKTLGAHPYLTVPAHTRYTRETLGSNAFLAPEHKVVLTQDDEQARTIGRPAVQNPYLGLRNYTNNLMLTGSPRRMSTDQAATHSLTPWSLTVPRKRSTPRSTIISRPAPTTSASKFSPRTPPPRRCRPSASWPSTAVRRTLPSAADQNAGRTTR